MVCLASLGCERPATQGGADRLADAPSDLEQGIFEAVNVERQQHGLQPLHWSAQILAAARDHSARMARLGFFSHEDPKLGSLEARLRRFGARAWAAGENLFFVESYADPVRQAVQSWLKSPGHRQNMLSRQYTETAVGVARAGSGTIYCTQIFVRPFVLGW